MLLPSTEVILIGAVIGLYLYDSAVLLYGNEAMMYPGRSARWAVQFGSSRFQWRGRDVFLPNPLTPQRPLYRATWRYGEPTPAAAAPGHLRRDYRPLAVMTGLMAVALIGLLPLGLFSRLGDIMVVAALLLFYGAACGAFGYLWMRRQALGLSRRRLLHLMFESLTCPPFAVNLVRHVSLATQPPVDLVQAAHGWQSREDWENTRTMLIDRLQEELVWLDSAAPEAVHVAAELARLQAMSSRGGDESSGEPPQEQASTP